MNVILPRPLDSVTQPDGTPSAASFLGCGEDAPPPSASPALSSNKPLSPPPSLRNRPANSSTTARAVATAALDPNHRSQPSLPHLSLAPTQNRGVKPPPLPPPETLAPKSPTPPLLAPILGDSSEDRRRPPRPDLRSNPLQPQPSPSAPTRFNKTGESNFKIQLLLLFLFNKLCFTYVYIYRWYAHVYVIVILFKSYA